MQLLRAFATYERRFAGAMSLIPERNPVNPDDRHEIRAIARNCLGIKQDWIPRIKVEATGVSAHRGFRIERLQGQSWPEAHLAAHLYLPEKRDTVEPMPLVLLCCGHGEGGKLNPGYQAMARHLARFSAAVLVPDNIGQGERAPMGHRDAVAPFYCGTSLQGLIVMEDLGWLAWARQDPRFDHGRMAAIGNSGGGHATCFLAALDEELAAISSSGRLGTFEYTARKERMLCGCAIVPGIVGELEMWQLYGCFAPRPMFLFQGENDRIFPWDLFYHNARKVMSVYQALDAGQQLLAATPPGNHPWDARRRAMLGDFIRESLRLGHATMPIDPGDDDLLNQENGRCHKTWPADAVNTDQLAQQLTGIPVPAALELADVFPPRVSLSGKMRTIMHHDVPQNACRVLAQFEAFLKK